MISITRLIKTYRHLRQHSPVYDALSQCWQIADYDSVQTILKQIEAATDADNSPGEIISAPVITAHIQGDSFRATRDLIQDVLKPLSDSLLTPVARQIAPQVMPHLADVLTGSISVHALQSHLTLSTDHAKTVVYPIIQQALFITLAGNTLYMLLMHPAQFALLQAHPEYMPRAVQEVLRLTPPVHRLRWKAPADIPLSQTVIQSGQSIDLIAAAAGRDALVYRNADVFNMRRRLPRPVPVLHRNWIPQKAVVDLLQFLLPLLRGMRLLSPETVIWHESDGLHRLEALPVIMNKPAKK